MKYSIPQWVINTSKDLLTFNEVNPWQSYSKKIHQVTLKSSIFIGVLTLERMEGSAEITADNDFIALVLMATALSLSTLKICQKILLLISSITFFSSDHSLVGQICNHCDNLPDLSMHQNSWKMTSMRQDILWPELLVHNLSDSEMICKGEREASS